ncbi:hypothetical protein [Paucibacter soli]|uniref:hypothetical protein n=1 Tax=Paucibacter soli TaxID=3133433 RepID=UPI00309D299F
MMFITNAKTHAAVPFGLAVMLTLAPAVALALPTINLTNADYNGTAWSTTGTITNSFGTVTFQRDTTQPAGTGVFNPFLRLDVKGNLGEEQGYNTSATITTGSGNNQTTRKVLDNMSPVNWTHDVLISSLQLTADGLNYQFKLDINEPGSDKASLLSLDGLKLYSTSLPSQSGEALTNKGDIVDGVGGIVGTKLWDMDAAANNGNGTVDRSVLLDATTSGGPGSGVADMLMLVDRKIIDQRVSQGEQYLVLWSRFGLDQGAKANTALTTADAGFEEWSFSAKSGTVINPPPPPPGVPAPGTISLAMLALIVLGRQYRTRRNPVSAA